MSDYRLVKTYHVVNWILFAVGFLIVCATAHSWAAVFGAWLASLHLTVTADGTRTPR